jgi:cephalosporin-C deacetylase-like acetyl esterase
MFCKFSLVKNELPYNPLLKIRFDRLYKNLLLVCLLSISVNTAAYAAPVVAVTQEKLSGIYRPGEKIIWDVKVSGTDAKMPDEATYVIREGGLKTVNTGKIVFQSGTANIESSLNEPGTLLAEISVSEPGGNNVVAFGGAAVAPESIGPSFPCPDDFDAFWKAKIQELSVTLEDPVLEEANSEKQGVAYWNITMNGFRGSHIHGQLAKPSQGAKFPAMLILQWAGVYPLQKKFATDYASAGWLTLNIMAHDLPIDQPKEFYEEKQKNALKDYSSIGNDDREKSYFLRMFLSCYRAAEYLAKRPDWDGKTLIVTGVSQGGLQSFATAGLNPRITAVMVDVPAGCDYTGSLAGRKPGWPNWLGPTQGKDVEKVTTTSRYFECVNFAARIKCPVLIGMGLIDVTAPPSGIFAAANQLKGPKRPVVIPAAGHMPHNYNHAPYDFAFAAWRKALLKGVPLPMGN